MLLQIALRVLEWVRGHKALTATLLALLVTAASLQVTTWQRNGWKAQAQGLEKQVDAINARRQAQMEQSTVAAKEAAANAAKWKRLYAALKLEVSHADDQKPLRDVCPAFDDAFRLLNAAGGTSPAN